MVVIWQGVIDKLDYIEGLGVNALYLQPQNDSSMHKYDPRNYHHIDINFGPDPRRFARLWNLKILMILLHGNGLQLVQVIPAISKRS